MPCVSRVTHPYEKEPLLSPDQELAEAEIQRCIEMLNQAERRMNSAASLVHLDSEVIQQCEYALDDIRSDLEGLWGRYEDEHIINGEAA